MINPKTLSQGALSKSPISLKLLGTLSIAKAGGANKTSTVKALSKKATNSPI